MPGFATNDDEAKAYYLAASGGEPLASLQWYLLVVAGKQKLLKLFQLSHLLSIGHCLEASPKGLWFLCLANSDWRQTTSSSVFWMTPCLHCSVSGTAVSLEAMSSQSGEDPSRTEMLAAEDGGRVSVSRYTSAGPQLRVGKTPLPHHSALSRGEGSLGKMNQPLLQNGRKSGKNPT